LQRLGSRRPLGLEIWRTSKVKRRGLALLAGLLVIGLTPGLTLAANPANIDQQNPVGAAQANDGGHTFAQTITVGKTGSFSSVDLWLGGGGSVTVDIEAVDGSDHPTGAPLATGTGAVAQSAAWVNFAFVTPLAVTPGTHLAIVFDTTDFAYGSDSGTDTYAGGVGYWFNTVNSTWTPLGLSELLPPDLAFRTYVDPASSPSSTPPPTSSPSSTPPPTSTLPAASTPAGGGFPMPLPIALVGAFGLVLFLNRQLRRRTF
jgi:hypothetical protein